MARLIRYDTLIEIMRIRYDFYSARAVLERAVEDAGLPAAKVAFTAAEVRAVADILALRKRDRVEEVVHHLRQQALAAEAEPEPAAAAAQKKPNPPKTG